MNLKFIGSVIFVKDIKRSKQFYSEILGQKVDQDYEQYVGFEGGFGIWESAYAMSIIMPGRKQESLTNSCQMELYFESDDLDGLIRHLKSEDVSFIHDCKVHDWGQRGCRIQDPDGILIDISEPMRAVIHRLNIEGLSIPQIAERTGMSISEIKSML